MLTPEILGSGYYKTAGQTKYAVEVSGYGKTGYQAFDHSVTDTACEFIRSRRDSDRPYALVVGLILPHNPLICAKDLFEYYMEQIPPLELQSQEYLNNLHPALKKWRQRRGVDDLTPEQNRRGLAAYSGLVTEMDRNVGRIIKAIRTQPSVDNTVIIYTSDHGDMACEHGMWWKSSFYEGSVSVPLIFSWPGHFQKNKTENSIVSLIDVGPTVLDIASAAPLPDVSGKSFAGFLTGEDIPDWSNEVFAEYCGLWGDQPSCMIRTGPWKLNYYHEFLSCQLFNIKVDPDERHDRANDPDCAEVVKFCLQKIHARWSAEALLENFAKQERAREVLQSCGHAAVPHEVGRFTTPEGCNEFDFSQLPKVPSSSAVK